MCTRQELIDKARMGISFTEDNYYLVCSGEKTVTRRRFNKQDRYRNLLPSDILYLLEPLEIVPLISDDSFFCSIGYTWSPGTLTRDEYDKMIAWRWKNNKLPARYMPKEHARRFIRIINNGVCRLGDITKRDAKKEGVENLDGFYQLWQSIHGGIDKQEIVRRLEFEPIMY